MDFDINLLNDVGGAEREEKRRKMLSFAKHLNVDYVPNWHHKLLCDRLDDFAAGRIKRLMVFMPPQEGKSELTSRMFPAFLLGKYPDAKVSLASYSADIAEGFNRDVQKYMDTEAYAELFPNTKLSVRNNGGTDVRNTKRFDIVGRKGFLKTVGVGGSLTGTPVDYGIIDDPHKDMQDATSPAMQQTVWDWYVGVFKARTHNNSGILLIQTRWDTKDLAGRILELMELDEHAEQWTIICLQAIKENDDNPDDPRKIGEALWPDRHNLKFLNDIKRADPRTFQHLYQQNPKPVQVGGEAYRSFDEKANVHENRYNPNLPLHATFDFNVSPYMSCGIWQIEREERNSKTYFRAIQIDEICLKAPHNNTKGVCAAIRHRYAEHNAGLYIYGDPNGMKEDTRSEAGHNDYAVIKKELERYRPVIRVFKKAPSVKMRIDFMNTLFAGGYDGLDISIGTNCYRTIEDFQYVKEDADGTKLKTKFKDPVTGATGERWGHMSDNTEYFICFAFAGKYNAFINGGRTTNITVGQRKTRHSY